MAEIEETSLVQEAEDEQGEVFVIPASFAQQRLWFFDQLKPGNTVYNTPFAVGLQGRLDVQILERCLQEIVARHETLRTGFELEEGQLMQVIAPARPLRLAVYDLPGVPAEEREEIIAKRSQQETDLPFDLTRGPLLRAALLRFGAEDHVLLVTIHHIISDGWSIGVLIQELVALYEAFAAGQPSPLPELPLQYADYAIWQEELLQGEFLETQLGYWREKLAGELPVLQLPQDRPRPAVLSYAGASYSFTLPKTLSDDLAKLSQWHGVTLFMTLLSAYQTLLYRYTGQEDLLVGSPIAGRRRAELEGLIGFFVNTLVLRTDLAGNPTFAELLERVQTVTLDAYSHQDLPFEQLVEDLAPARNMSHAPLFQTLFVLQNAPAGKLELDGLSLALLPSDNRSAIFDLSLSMVETEQGLEGTFEYSTDLFDLQTVERLAGHFLQLLQAVAADPQQKIGELAMLSGTELQELLQGPEAVRISREQAVCVHQLFEQHAARTPEQTAVVFGAERLTYRELNERANLLAHELRRRGTGTETPVGLYLERSLDSVVGLLAIWKAGGIYVPLDPAHPAERVQMIAEDAGLNVLVTTSELAKSVLAAGADLLLLDQEWERIAVGERGNPESGVSAEHLAYLIFTSGSTGRPKGVMVEHGNLWSVLETSRQQFGFEATDVMPWIASATFDIALFELFNPLLAGGTAVLMDKEQVLNLPQLVQDLQACTAFHVVPSLMRQIVETIRQERIRVDLYDGVRRVFTGGDAVPPDLLDDLQTVFRQAEIRVIYGPTEGSIICADYLVPRGQPQTRKLIGRALHNSELRLYDRHGQPVPLGVPGELYIGGSGVTRGYLGQPDLTAEKFVTLDGRNWYRSGDWVRRLNDGTLEFLGRIDDQVKIRGFRIELGEVEAVALQHPAVRAAVAMVREDVPGDKRLAAYAVPMEADGLTAAELLEFFKSRLPEYLVPSGLVVLEQFPLNPNGKVDRKKLPAPQAVSVAQAEYVPPQTATEQLVADIWSELFGAEQVGAQEHFFEGGGHSLLATQVVSRLYEQLGLRVPLQLLFERPVLREFAKEIELLQQGEHPAAAAGTGNGIGRADRSAPLPVSFAQNRLWILERLHPGTAAYNMPFAVRLEGALDHGALERALQEIAARHEVLRTVIVEQGGQPVQVVLPAEPTPLAVTDLSALEAEAGRAEARRLVQAEAERPFAIDSDAMLRRQLFRLSAAEHVLFVNMHHIASDGWSMSIFLEELGALYAAFANGAHSPLSALPIQYADFAVWQRKWMQGEELEQQLGYWKTKLGGGLETLQLPTDHPRPARPSQNGAAEKFILPQRLTEQLRELCREHDVTLFMALLGAWQTLLHRYSGQTDIAVGTSVAGRRHQETEALIGFFINTLVLRTDLAGSPSYLDVLHRVRETALGAFGHQDVPFERLVEAIQPERDLSRSPLFQVMFVLQNAPLADLHVSELTMSPMELDVHTSKFDLTLSMEESADGMSGALEYSTDLFEAETIRRMIGHLQQLLESIVQAPHAPVEQLPMLTAAETDQLAEWAVQSQGAVARTTIHAQFARQAALHPDSLAVADGERSYTYRELDEQANRIAHRLRAMGLQPNEPAGILLGRTAEMAAAVLGVLKAGGAYVPLDPDYPAERLAFMADDCGAKLVLSSAQWQDVLPAAEGRATLLVEAIAADEPAHAPAEWNTAQDLAYLIYTSGSTGRPKGTMLRHAGVLNLAQWKRQEFGYSSADTVLQFASFSFDASVEEIFCALLNGAGLYVLRGEERMSAEAFAKAVSRTQATLVTLPTAFFHKLGQLLPEEQAGNLQSLREVFTAGEELPADAVQVWQKRFGNIPLTNVYGPTESTVAATFQRVTPKEAAGQPVPIGRPLLNTEAYLLNAALQPVPVNVPGELYLGGIGLAAGYLHLPEQTAERFLPHPFAGRAGERLYRTGDLAKFLPDGSLQYLGRADQQVKLRGFRIEPGEIEAALLQVEGISEACLILREDLPGEKRLVAYVAGGADFDVKLLRERLKELLPEHYIPSAFVQLAQLPLTPNGKIDRRALPAPDADAGAGLYVAPRTPLEELAAAVFADVLRVERVGAEDDFFARGGHSLLAMQAVSRLNEALGCDVPLSTLFEHRTPAAVAKQAALWTQGAGRPIERASREGDLPLSFAQSRLWMLDRLAPGTALYNMPTVLRMAGALDAAALADSFSALLDRHESLRTTFAERAGEGVQMIAPVSEQTLVVTDLTDLPDAEREAEAQRLAQSEAGRPFDLQHGPLVRAQLLKLRADDHLLILNMHHIISDGWSVDVMVRELAELYDAFASGRPHTLEPLPLQYADYAVWQREQLRGEALEQQLAYWKGELGGELSILQLPTDRPRPPVQTHHGAVYRFELPDALAGQLQQLAHTHGATMFMTLLAGFQTLLHRLSGQEDIPVGTPIAGRSRQETEGMIGFFVNTLVMRGDLSARPTFAEQLRRVRETALGAYAHQDMPFEKLVEELQPERDLSRTPLFQVMFTLETAPGQDLELSGLTWKPLTLEQRMAKFDLALTMSGSDGTISGGFEYNTDLFDEATIARMAGHLTTLLTAAAADPEQLVAELPLLTAAERAELLAIEPELYRTDVACVHHLFETQAQRTPDATAVRFQGAAMTYRELNERANVLAHELLSLGAGPEKLVGLHLDRSAELVIGALGILKAGAAYVPLDPTYPSERLAMIMEDADLTALVSLAPPAVGGQIPVVRPTAARRSDNPQSDNPQSGVQPANLAYMIYTSGSTGRPKGVMVEHGNLHSTLQASLEQFPLGAGDIMPWIASAAFDISLFELFLPLLAGGAVEVLTRDEVLDAPYMAERMQTYAALHAVPNLMRQYVQAIRPESGQYDRLRMVFIGGEAVQSDLLEDLQAKLPASDVYVLYGPTEATILCTSYPVPEHLAREGAMIGKRLSNATLRLYDQNGQPVPLGVPGELYIGGAGVTRGYYGQAELTQDKFVWLDGMRWYKSGDLVRRLADGTLEFLGRIDNQVKIRGFRIELGEIEAVLQQVGLVSETLVIAREDQPGQKRIVAYYVPREGQHAASEQLHAHLKSRLPDYMVPSAFVELAAMPLTPNGKIDRKALPAPEADGFGEDAAYTAPRTELEALAADVFAEVLNVGRVGADDDFFARGGHSLLAMQVMARLNERLGAEIPLRALFEQRTPAGLALQAERLTRGALDSIPSVSRAAAIPLSFAQARLWLLDRLLPGTALYNMPSVLRLTGELDVAALEHSFHAMLQRHEILRTTFAEAQGEPVQVIAPFTALALERSDLRALPQAKREDTARELAVEAAQRPFDLQTGPLVRAHLLELAADDHLLVVNMHHIISDGWSMGVFVRELSALYNATVTGHAQTLAAQTVQYADYAVWQRSPWQSERREAQLAYWKEKLSGELPVLQLPTDRPRPPVQTHHGAMHSFKLSGGLTDALQTLSGRAGTTLFMTLLGAFQTLLYRWSGQEDIVVGTPVAGRSRTETENMIGFFVNTLALRSDLSGEPAFLDLLAQVRETALGAYAHQEVPFEKLVEELQPDRDLSRTPLFQAMFSLQNMEISDLTLHGLQVEQVEVDTRTAKFDLTLLMQEGEDGLVGSLEYNTDLFDAVTIERMALHLQTLLAGIVANPQQKISELPVLSAAERQQMLVEWNDTKADFPRNICLHQLFEAQAERTPELIAAVYGEQSLTYRELEAKSNQLAHHLIALGVGPDVPVGVCVERSLELVIALLGVLKAGGAFVPVDTEAPVERIEQLLQESQAAVCLSQAHLKPGLPTENSRFVYLDEEWAQIGSQPASRPQTAVQPHHLVSIYYTSGSTGKPKGVANEHLGWVNRMIWNQQEHQLQAGETVLQKTTLGFDDSAVEFFWPLMVGGRIALLEPGMHRDPRAILEAAVQHEAVLVQFVPSVLRLFLEAVTPEDERRLQALRSAVSSGEALRPELWQLFRDRLPGRKLYNLCGATEVSIDSTVHLCNEQDLSGEIVSIGKPFMNNTVYILDTNRQPVPVGVIGEIYYGGVGLARGYLNRPDLTERAFLDNPFEPGTRMYKTGDRAYFRRDGSVQFLGRNDDQVKIRGVRVEPGEVEVVLAAHPSIQHTVVVARQDDAGEKRLVAYAAVDPANPPQSGELRRYLQEKLPEVMIPSAFVLIDDMPLTPNGKVDRKALPAPELDRIDRAAFVEPQTDAERQVAAVYAEVLQIGSVGAEDHFFELGGHSLLAAQVISRLNERFGMQIPLRTLFESPSVSQLAAQITGLAQQGPGALPPIELVPRSGHLPLSFAQQRLWVIDKLEPGSPLYNMPAALRLQGEVSADAMERSLQAIILRHETLRTRFDEVNGEPVQIISEPLPALQLTRHDLRALPAEQREREVLRLTEREAQTPFDLQQGHLIRTLLLQLDEHDYVLVLNVHHIVSDGWSTGVLIREFAALYEAFRSGRPDPLPPLPVQYADYAHWQRSWMQGDLLDEQIAYWKKQLGGERTLLQLPTDRPRPQVQTHRGAVYSFAADKGLTEELQALSRRFGTTMFMTLLAAFQTLLYRWSGQADIWVGTPIAGRSRQETESLIGFFVNTLVMRADLSDRPTFAEALRRVRETALGAYAHQELPFEKLVEELQPERDLSRTPLFQVMFALQNMPGSDLELSGVTCTPLDVEHRQAKFDLELTMAEGEGEGGLAGGFVYNTDLFDEATIARMSGHLLTLLQAAAADPERSVAELPILTAPERLLLEAEQPVLAAGDVLCVPQLFEQQAEATPDQVAVTAHGAVLTYRELNERANSLAHELIRLGAGPEKRIGVHLHRSADLVVALLGIFKSGAAYVPLDPEYPQERLALILGDAGLTALVSETVLDDSLPTIRPHVEGSVDNPAHSVLPEHLAYLIYTSGSTGRPKGVMVEHGNLAATLAASRERFGFGAGDVMPWIASAAFDIALFEVLNPLLTGGAVDVLTRDEVLDLPGLAERMQGYTALHAVPSLMRQLVQEARAKGLAFDRLRLLFTGGDAVPPDLLEELSERFPQTELYVLYGPTEGTIICSSYRVPQGRAERFYIGQSLPGAQLRLYDQNGQLVPSGVPGELLIGGGGVTRGYHAQEALTAERYIQIDGKRWYKTGDLARRLPDGTLEFLGRIDSQVKIRGFRIELGEVETALGAHPDVAAAVVTVHTDSVGNKFLAAYAERKGDAAATEEDLLADLARKLPAYMVPSVLLLLDRLPLNQNGKVDRKQLPAPELAGRNAEHLPPQSELELQLSGLWQELLGTGDERVGLRDSFFRVGGHSLLAVQLLSRIEQQYGIKIPFAAFYQEATIEAVARSLQQGPGTHSSLVPLQTKGTKQPLFLVHAAGGSVHSYAELAGLLEERPVYAFQAQGVEGEAEPLASIEEMAAAYLSELKTVQPEGPYLLGGWSMGGMIAYELAQQLRAAGDTVSQLVLFDTEPAAAGLEETPPALLFAADLLASAGVDPVTLQEQASALSGTISLQDLVTHPILQELLPSAYDGGKLEPLFRVFQANDHAYRSYRAAASDQAVLLLRAAEQGAGEDHLPDVWAGLTGNLKVEQVPGDHHSMLHAPHVQTVAGILHRSLDK